MPGAPASTGDSTTAITHLVFGGSYSPTERIRAAQGYLAQVARPDGAPVGVTGVTPARIEQGTLILNRIGLVELLTVFVIAVIVLVVFRAPGAAVVTMATIGVAFPITLWALTEIARISGSPLPQEVEPLVVALLLGVVTDYAVFFLSEFRDQLRSGAESRDAATVAAQAVIPIVFTGGVILSLSLLALRASSLGFFRQLAPALAVTVAVAMLVSLVFVPALIALLGRFAVWPTRPEQGVDEVAPGRPIGHADRTPRGGAPAGCPDRSRLRGGAGLRRPAGPLAEAGRGRDLGASRRQRATGRGSRRRCRLRARRPGTARGDRPGAGDRRFRRPGSRRWSTSSAVSRATRARWGRRSSPAAHRCSRS